MVSVDHNIFIFLKWEDSDFAILKYKEEILSPPENDIFCHSICIECF